MCDVCMLFPKDYLSVWLFVCLRVRVCVCVCLHESSFWILQEFSFVCLRCRHFTLAMILFCFCFRFYFSCICLKYKDNYYLSHHWESNNCVLLQLQQQLLIVKMSTLFYPNELKSVDNDEKEKDRERVNGDINVKCWHPL